MQQMVPKAVPLLWHMRDMDMKMREGGGIVYIVL